MEPDGRRVLFFNNNGKQTAGPGISGNTLYLRSDTVGDDATFAWSNDGKSWTKTGWHYTLVFGNWRGNRPGVFCWNSITDDAAESGHADVDWFRYNSGRCTVSKRAPLQ
jgi:beta-xylosidase